MVLSLYGPLHSYFQIWLIYSFLLKIQDKCVQNRKPFEVN